MKRILISLFAINTLAVVVFGAYTLSALTADMDVGLNYNIMVRQNVINRTALAKFSPGLAANDGYLVPRWLIEPIWPMIKRNAIGGLLLATVNAILTGYVIVAMKRKRSAGTPILE